MRFEFEKIDSPIYPAYLHVGAYSIALEPQLIEALKQHALSDTASFLDVCTEKIGSNRYLKAMILEAISGENEGGSSGRNVLTQRLCEELRRV